MSGDYRYKVGQIVEILPTTLRSAAPGAYEIMRLVPLEGGAARYCLKSRDEKHERIVPEHDLLPVVEPAAS